MKRIAKYSLAALSGVLLLAGCEEFEEFQTTVGAPDKLIYTQTGDNSLYTVQVKHRPTGSTGEFSAKFPVRSNTTQHGDMKATFAYDGSLVEEYNETNGTTYEVLPEEYLLLENATLTLPENAQRSIDSITVSLTGGNIRFYTRGFGHGVGMSQTGANAMGIAGSDYREILLHYYTGTTIGPIP